MSLLQGTGESLLVCKGALEEMVPLCSALEDGEELLPLDDRSGLPMWLLHAHTGTDLQHQ